MRGIRVQLNSSLFTMAQPIHAIYINPYLPKQIYKATVSNTGDFLNVRHNNRI